MKLSGSRIIIETLLEQGVDTVFGYPGGAILPLYDALCDAPVRHILTVHEQGAAHAADGYARASGRVGVCIATSGPGATNLVTGLATAYMDSSPIVAITGQVGTQLLGRDAFQGVDVTGISMPITKHNYLVQDIASLADTMREAFAVAREGRPGPVLVDVPRDVLTAEFDYQEEEDSLPLSVLSLDEAAINRSVEFLDKALRPVMLVGGGARSANAQNEAIAFAESMDIPIVSTLMGLGVIPTQMKGFLGLTGMHGHRTANCTVAGADLILAVGTRFSDRVTGDRTRYTSGKTVIQLDVDSGEVGRNISADVELIGNLRATLTCLTEKLHNYNRMNISAWRDEINAWLEIEATHNTVDAFGPQWIMRNMSEATSPRPVTWVTDVGQHQMWAAQHLDLLTPRSWITSGGMGTMGFGLPAAMGAQVACPDNRVVVICGDGGFKMTGMELYTIVTQKIPLICVIVDNHALGMVRQLQHAFCDRRYFSVNLPSFDFAGFAQICGAKSFMARTPDEFAAAFSQSLHHDGPSVIVADISILHLVEPMVQPGQRVDQFIDLGHSLQEVK